MLVSPPCVLCGGSSFSVVITGTRDIMGGKPGVFDVQRCDGCSLVATRPRPTGEALSEYYDVKYASPEQRRRAHTISSLGDVVPRYRLRVLRHAHPLSAKDRILDVGCSYGSFLAAARRETGCTAVGVDSDRACIEGAIDPGNIRYVHGTLGDVGNGPFEVITFYESLEHHEDPLQALQQAREMLAPGGILVVEVPNFSSPLRMIFRRAWLPLLIPQHLTHFTRSTLTELVKKAGLTPIASRGMFFPTEVTGSIVMVMRGWAQRMGRDRLPALVRLVAAVVLFWMFFLVEIPLQALLAVLGISGHQTLIARK